MYFAAVQEAESERLENLRQRLNDSISSGTLPANLNFTLLTDMLLKRFLRGHKGSVDKAHNGIIKHLEWRVEFGVDGISAESCPNEIRKGLSIIKGYCKSGRPTIYCFAERHDSRNRDKNELRSFIIYMLEEVRKLTIPDDEKITLVFDMNNFTMRNLDYEIIHMLIGILQLQYPETLGLGIILDAPFFFHMCWKIIHPWLDPVTASKVIFLANVKDLLEYIDESQLPNELCDRLVPQNGKSVEKVSLVVSDSSKSHGVVDDDVEKKATVAENLGKEDEKVQV